MPGFNPVVYSRALSKLRIREPSSLEELILIPILIVNPHQDGKIRESMLSHNHLHPFQTAAES